MVTIWHYSTWARLPEIVKSGVLKASNAGAVGERPMLWFSKNQKWESTATKMIVSSHGHPVKLTFKQQAEQFGATRFGLVETDPRFLKWKDACAAAGTPRETRRLLEKVGKKQGGDPDEWFAIPTSVPLTELHFQLWSYADGWKDATSPQDMAKIWTEMRGKQTRITDSG